MVVDEQLLDDVDALAAADHYGCLVALASAGAHIRAALTAVAEAPHREALTPQNRPRAVVVASLGGSAIVGDVLTMVAGPGSPAPVSVCRGLPLPGWVGPLDLVLAVSMSGRAPGPLGLAAEAARRGARLVTVGAADSPLQEVTLRTRGVHVTVPPSANAAAAASRLALWSMLTPVLAVAHTIGLTDTSPQVLHQVADRLDAAAAQYRPASETFVNPAKTLAVELSSSIPVLLGDGPVAGAAAGRAAAMLARTSRVPAMWGELPDDASEVVATFGGPFAARTTDDIFADPFLEGGAAPLRQRLLMLRDAEPSVQHPDGTWLETAKVAQAVLETAQDAGVAASVITANAGHPIERFADLVALTDFASVYLALATGSDPLVSPSVADLRDRTR